MELPPNDSKTEEPSIPWQFSFASPQVQNVLTFIKLYRFTGSTAILIEKLSKGTDRCLVLVRFTIGVIVVRIVVLAQNNLGSS
jgi:hypothetical protein